MARPPDNSAVRRAAGAILACALLVARLPGGHAQGAQEGFAEILGRARVEMRSGRVDEAARLYNAAADSAESADARAQAWYELSRELESRRLYTEAIEPLTKIAALEPPSLVAGAALQRLATLHQRLKQYPEADAAYRRLSELAGADPWTIESALWGRARVWQEAGDLKRAADISRDLVARFPDGRYVGSATSVLVEERIAAGDVAAARKLAEQEAGRDQGNPGLLLRVAARLREDGQFPAALEVLEGFLERQPDSVTALKLIYDLHRQAESLAEYETELRKRTGAEPQALAVALRLVDFYERQGQPDDALRVLEQLAKANPGDAALTSRIADVAIQAGNLDRAAEHLSEAVRLNPDDLQLRGNLGDVYSRMGRREDAVAQWRIADRYSPDDPATARMFGMHLHSNGFYQDALDTYLQGRKAAGTAGFLAAEIGQTYEALLRIEDAVREYVSAMGDPSSVGLAEYRLQGLAADQVVGPEVIAALERCAGQADLPPPAGVALGVAYLRAQRTEDAMRLLGGLPPSEATSQALLQAASMVSDQGDADTALLLHDTAWRQERRPAVAARLALDLADLCISQGRWGRARETLEAALGAGPPDQIAETLRLRLADAHLVWGGDPTRARKLCEHVAAFTSDEEHKLQARWGLADCAFAEGDFASAAREYRLLGDVSDDPNAPPPPPGAFRIPTVEFGLASGPLQRPMGPDWALLRLAEILFRAGDMARAAKLFAAVASAYPDGPHANEALSRQLLIAGEFTGASPAEPKYIEALGMLDRGEVEAALRSLGMIASLGPDEPLADDAALLIAEALRCTERIEDARARYEKIASEFPDSPLVEEALLAAARLAAREPARREEAIGLLRQVIARAPEGPEAAEAQRGLEELTRH